MSQPRGTSDGVLLIAANTTPRTAPVMLSRPGRWRRRVGAEGDAPASVVEAGAGAAAGAALMSGPSGRSSLFLSTRLPRPSQAVRWFFRGGTLASGLATGRPPRPHRRVTHDLDAPGARSDSRDRLFGG